MQNIPQPRFALGARHDVLSKHPPGLSPLVPGRPRRLGAWPPRVCYLAGQKSLAQGSAKHFLSRVLCHNPQPLQYESCKEMGIVVFQHNFIYRHRNLNFTYFFFFNFIYFSQVTKYSSTLGSPSPLII